MGNPTISIIVPVYNTERHLKKCVDSLLTQTHTNLEIILVNDGSDDSSPQICDAYAAADARVRVLHQQNAGLSAARNAGLDASTGSLIGFIDSDDYIDSNMFEDLLRALEMNDADMSMCGIRHVFEEGSAHTEEAFLPRDEVIQGQEAILSRLGRADNWLWVVACNKLYRRELFYSIRYPIGKLHEDEFVIHHLLLSCQKVVSIAQPLYNYLQHDMGITRSGFTLRRLDGAEAQFDRAAALLAAGLPPREAYYASSAGLMAMSKGYVHLDSSDSQYKARYGNLRQQFRQVADKLLRTDLPLAFKMRLWINRFSPYYAWRILEKPLRRIGYRA